MKKIARRALALFSLVVVVVASMSVAPSTVGAHTGADMVAVPAGSTATVTLKPTHGCGESPTTEVYVRAPVENATAVDVAGWTSSAAPDGQGNTVLEWKGGPLPTDQTGAFAVNFVVPQTPGELLTFPAVQACQDGAELAWIDGDPEADYPAPRLLVLPAGAAPAASIEEIPMDAPGRELLTQILDVDNPASTTTTTEATTTTTATPTTEPAEPTEESAAVGDTGDTGGSPPLWAVAVLVVAVLVGIGAAVLRRRRPQPE